MSDVDTGHGDPIVFLHGNPTSSYIWRNIIPFLSECGRCLAPDLVGMGQSGKSEMAAYRAPFLVREARLPTLVWPREIPIDDEPRDVTAIVERCGNAMALSTIPKLLIVGEPGAVIKGRTLEFCQTWPNQTEVTVKGLHFLQEDSPDEIGRALQAFVQSVPAA